MFYDFSVENAKNPDIDFDHILMDNFDRLPTKAKEKYLGSDFIKYNNETEIRKREKIITGRPTNSKHYLQNVLRLALDKSIKRAEWNYRTGVPMYYIKEGEMTILLPIAFADEIERLENLESDINEEPAGVK